MTESESTLRQRIPHPIFVDHPFKAVTINRGALSDDPAIQAVIAEELNVVGQRLGRSFPNTTGAQGSEVRHRRDLRRSLKGSPRMLTAFQNVSRHVFTEIFADDAHRWSSDDFSSPTTGLR